MDNSFELLALEEHDVKQFKTDMQDAFQLGYEQHFGKTDEIILPDRDIEQSLSSNGAVAYKAIVITSAII